MTPLSSVFISFLSWSSFPLVSFIVSTLPLWGGLSSMWKHLFPGKALHLLLFLLPPVWFPDLSFHRASWSTASLLSAFLSGHEMEPSLSSLPAVHVDLSCLFWMRTLVTLCLESYFSVSFYRPSIHKVTFVQQMCTHDGYKLFRVSQMSWSWISPGEGERVINIIPQHTWRDRSK